MTSNALTIFDPANVPGHVVAFNEENTNIGDKLSVDSLGYKGKVWTVALSGNKQILMRKNDDGDEEPRSTIPVIILDYNKRRGRSWYEEGFQDDKPQIPACWSPDGIEPDPSSQKRQARKCNDCPLSVKGSKTTDAGTQTTACQQYRMVAVQLYKRWELPPLRLRLAITSDYDAKGKDNEAKGWFAFQQLVDMLRARGVKHTGAVVVRLKFDASVAYPKVLFSPIGWASGEELPVIKEIADSDAVKSLLSPTFTPSGTDGHSTAEAPPAEEDPDVDGPALAPAKPAKVTGRIASKPKPDPEPEPEEPEEPSIDEAAEDTSAAVGDEDEVNEIVEATEAADEDDPEVAAQKAANDARARALQKQQDKAKAAAEARKAAAAAPDPDDEGEIVVSTPAKPAAAKPAATAPAKPADKPAAQAATKPAATPAKAATPAPAKTAAAPGKPSGPKAVSPAVAATLNEWQDD